jgi:3-(3-hydroxy-phenyl)propionate hydroxylase
MRRPEERLEDLADEARAWELLEPWDVHPGNARMERHALYTFQARVAAQWQAGRAFLAGDAAHQMPPFAGQGMCSGLRDTANLAWKLDLVLAGKAPERLLDTYASERIPHVRATIDFSMALGRVICIADPAEAAARDAAMVAEAAKGPQKAPLLSGALGPGVVSEGCPRAGRLFVQGRVRHGDAVGLFDDVVGRGWTLLSPAVDPARQLEPEASAFFRSLGGISVRVGPGGSVQDLDGAYARWFEAAGVAVALQRPDFYVFGTAARLDGASGLVEGLRRSLHLER